MGKMGLAGTSLAAGVPGAVLIYVLLMGVLSGFDGMPMTMKIASLALLVISLLMVLFPLYILILFRRDKVVLASKAAVPAMAAAGAGDAEVFAGDLIEEDVQGVEEESWTPGEEFPVEGQADYTEAEADEDALATAEFTVEDLPVVEPEEFGQTLQIDELGQDSQPTMEFDVEEVEELDEFGKTMQEFEQSEKAEDFSATADFDDDFSFDDFEDDDKNKTKP